MKLSRSSLLLPLIMPAFYVALIMSLALSLATVAQAQSPLSADEQAEIRQLYALYNLELDGGNAQSWADTFVDDGSFNTFVGKPALVAFAEDFIASNPDTRHWNSNIHILPTDNGATGTAYLMLWKVSVQPAEVVLTGIYTDELVKTSRGWRFKSRVIKID